MYLCSIHIVKMFRCLRRLQGWKNSTKFCMQSSITFLLYRLITSFNKESTFNLSIYLCIFKLSICSDACGDHKDGRIAEYVGTCHSTLSIQSAKVLNLLCYLQYAKQHYLLYRLSSFNKESTFNLRIYLCIQIVNMFRCMWRPQGWKNSRMCRNMSFYSIYLEC